MRMPHFTSTLAAPKQAVIEIYDDIGPSWAGMIGAQLVSRALSDLGDVELIDVRINSRGGDAFEGFAIHNLLKQHPAQVNMRVDGVAASAASIVLMAGDRITVPKNAMVMIHDPITFAYGGEKEINAALSQWSSVRKSAAETYVSRTGLTAEKIASMMAEETWMTGEEAVAQKFADTMGPEVNPPVTQLSAETLPPFFTKAPEQFSRLVAMTANIPKDPPMTTTATTPATTPANPPATQPTTPADGTTPATPSLQAPATTPATDGKPATPPVVDPVLKAISDERSRVANITAMCSKAGKPELAQKHIDEGTEVSVVQSALFALMCAERPPLGSGGGTDLSAGQSGDDKFKAEYAKQRDVYLKAGVTEEQYLQTRRIDESGGIVPFA